ncbi:MAG: transglycosylase SLT domain-containing protein [Rhodospirillaceae bacterium]
MPVPISTLSLKRFLAFGGVMLLAVLAMLLTGGPASAARVLDLSEDVAARSAASLCARETARMEAQFGLPERLLTAISLVESGRYDKALGARIAWPWTVMAEGRGRYFRTKAEALNEVLALKKRGIRNIDVGCMQVNLHFHGSKFRSLEAALDPASNVAYAVDFLTRLHRETGSWAKAVTRYHSKTPEFAGRYAGRIAKAWQEIAKTGSDRNAMFGLAANAGLFDANAATWASSLPLGPAEGETSSDAALFALANRSETGAARPQTAQGHVHGTIITDGRIVPEGSYYELSATERLRRAQEAETRAAEQAAAQAALRSQRSAAIRANQLRTAQMDANQAKSYADQWRAKRIADYHARKNLNSEAE